MSRDPGDTTPPGPDAAELGGGRPGPSVPTAAVVVAFLVLAALYLYDLLVLVPAEPLVAGPAWPFEPWNLTQIDWMLAFSFVLVGWFVALLGRPTRVRSYWQELRRDRLATASLLYLSALFVVGLVAPLFVEPTANIAASYQPPVFAAVDTGVLADCLGTVVEHRCHGTWRYPLGTNFQGRGVLTYTVVAARVPVVIAVVTAATVVPVATVFGTASAYLGGRVDDLLMWVAEIVQTVPPVVAYILVRFVLGGTGNMALLVGVFGLFSWGNVARIVRDEALAKRGELFVTAAESAGAPPAYVVVRRLVPSLAGTVVAATTLQLPALVLTEAALSFLEFGAPGVPSWGTLIADGTQGTRWADLLDVWWISTVPVVALALTVAGLNVLGDSLEDVLAAR